MIHKHIGGKKNQRSVKNSLDYLLRTNKPEEQKFVEVLSQTNRSDIENFNEYIKEKNFKNPFITGVLSFEEKDIDPELKTKIMNDFEDMMFSGIDPENRPPVIWIQHKDKNRLELNYTTFNSLMNKKHFQCYYHLSDKKLFNSFCEKINYENNISSVLDVQEHKARNTLVNTLNNKIPEEKKAVVEKLQEEILSKIITEEINNREELISFIQSKNIIINRVRENAISIKFSKEDKPISLKGDIYEEGRDYSDYRKEFNPKPTRDPEFVREKLTELKRTFAERIEKREIRNRSKFKKPSLKNIPENRQSVQREDQDIGYKYTNGDFINVSNNDGFSGMYIRTDNMEIVNNESINTEYKAKTATEEERRIARKRDLEQINQQQQLIKRRIEEVRRTDSQLSKSVETTGERLRRDRRSLQSIIYNARRHIRTLSIYFKKNEHKRYFEEKKRLEEEKQFNQRRRKKFIY